MKKLVVDASVCLKWVFEEENSEKARLLLEMLDKRNILLLAPILWEYEIVNALTTAVRRNKITTARSRIFLKLLLQASPELISLSESVRECLEIARKYKISGYDGAYVTLAKEQGIVLISADQSLVEKISDRKIAISLHDFNSLE